MSQPPKSRSQSSAPAQNQPNLPSHHSSPSPSPAPGSRQPSQARPDIQAQHMNHNQEKQRQNARSPSVMSSDYDTEGPTEQRHRRRRIRGKKDLPPIDYDLETDESRNRVTTTGQKDVTRTGDPKQVRQGSGGDGEKDDKIAKLRLDLNLDVEVELKASVHGDVTLSMFESD
ncbi:hypothetical protein BDQ17DRAFT_1359832 [Cyathus striatus]|nr:hypothetical protein BDQ17DRAFT_1359832 [Cyathus striatus]